MGTGRESSLKQSSSRSKSGGARRDRTADLLHAMQALSQLSYGPTWRRGTLPHRGHFVKKMNDLRAPNAQGPSQSRHRFGPPEDGQSRIDGGRHGDSAHGEPNGLREFAERDAFCRRDGAEEIVDSRRRPTLEAV